MPKQEQRDRMRLMRELIRERNVYRWAAQMLMDACASVSASALSGKSEPSVRPLWCPFAGAPKRRPSPTDPQRVQLIGDQIEDAAFELDAAQTTRAVGAVAGAE